MREWKQKEKIEKRLVSEGMILDETDPELVITVGGDGTLLFAVQNYIDKLDKIKFVAIHTGTLGFYTDYTENQIKRLYAEKEAREDSKRFVEENNKQSLAQVFTDVRYTKQANEAFSKIYLDFIKNRINI